MKIKMLSVLFLFAILIAGCASVSRPQASTDIEKCECRIAYMKALLKDKNAVAPAALRSEEVAELKETEDCVLKRDISFYENKLQDFKLGENSDRNHTQERNVKAY